jgi:hypothetical protein
MKPDRSEEIGCVWCDWSLDQTPWISGRRLTWPGPIAHFVFLRHRDKNHRSEYLEWKKRYNAQKEEHR